MLWIGLRCLLGTIIYDLALEKQIAGEDGVSVRRNTPPARTGLRPIWEVFKILEVFIEVGLGRVAYTLKNVLK
jgi:hypothetical protein